VSLRKKAIGGVIWTFAQQFSVQIINFVVQIILARLLMPADFGLIAMLIVFISIGKMLMDGGMTSSLIRMKKPDQMDFSTVFVTNIIVSIAIYAIVFFCAPLISAFYEQHLLTDILRVFSLTFVIRAFAAVHEARLTKEMNFRTQMIMQVPATIVGAVVGVSMALNGYGVWSLVWLNVAQALTLTVLYWMFVGWLPTVRFNKRRFIYHFNFGYKLTLSGLLDTIYNDAYRIVIGKFFSPAQVGFFNQAETMRLFPVQQISSVMGKVTYPLFSNIDGDERLRYAYKTTMKLVLFVVIPMMLFLILVAEEGFTLLFGSKWLPAVPYFQVLAIASIIRPISSYNLNILKVKGRSDLFLKVEIIKKIIGTIAIVIGLPFGVMGLVISLTSVSFLFTTINMVYCGKLIDYSLWKQVKDVSKLFMVGLVTMAASYAIYHIVKMYTDSVFTIIGVVGAVFIVVYLSLSLLVERELTRHVKDILNVSYVKN